MQSNWRCPFCETENTPNAPRCVVCDRELLTDPAATAATQLPGPNDQPTALFDIPYGAPHRVSVDPPPTASALAAAGSGLPAPAPLDGRGRGALVGGIIVLVLVLALGGGMLAGTMTSSTDATPSTTTEDDETTTRPRPSSASTPTSISTSASTSTATSSTTTTTRTATTTETKVTTTSQAEPVATTDSSTPTVTTFSGSTVDLPQWTVMLFSIPIDRPEDVVLAELAKVRKVVPNAEMLMSSDVASLTPDHYAAFVSGFSDGPSALAYCDSILARLDDMDAGHRKPRDLCYAKHFSTSPDQDQQLMPPGE